MADEPEVEPDDGPDDTGPADPPSTRDDRSGGSAAAGYAQEGAGWVLGLLLWAWVALPFLKGGPTQVKNVWRAKFLNQAPDGSPLP